MDQSFLKAVINYIESSDNYIEKVSSLNRKLSEELSQTKNQRHSEEYVEKVANVVYKMAAKGVINEEFADVIIEKFASDPIKLAEFLIDNKDEQAVSTCESSNKPGFGGTDAHSQFLRDLLG